MLLNRSSRFCMISLQLRRSNNKLSNRCFPAKLAQFRHKKAKFPA